MQRLPLFSSKKLNLDVENQFIQCKSQKFCFVKLKDEGGGPKCTKDIFHQTVITSQELCVFLNLSGGTCAASTRCTNNSGSSWSTRRFSVLFPFFPTFDGFLYEVIGFGLSLKMFDFYFSVFRRYLRPGCPQIGFQSFGPIGTCQDLSKQAKSSAGNFRQSIFQWHWWFSANPEIFLPPLRFFFFCPLCLFSKGLL